MPDRTLPQLRIRVIEDLGSDQTPRVEVLAPDNTVLGDLSMTVVHPDGVIWKMGGKSGIGLLQITLACERGSISTIEMPGCTIEPKD